MAEQWIRQTLTAELLSDAHFGSGSGGGGIDALVARDRHGRPVIWVSHVEGLLRDAARRLFDDKAAEEFFGRAGSEQQRAVFTSLYTKGDRQSHIWRSTARAAFDNRAPKDDTLRVIEYVPRGTKFSGEVELPASQLNTLQRLIQEVDAFGSGRSTGAGRVKLTLSDCTCGSRKIGSATGRLILLLKNRDPLCITATATPDNLIPSLAFVPGRALLGAMAAWLIAEGDRDTASLFTMGKVSVSDALPMPHKPGLTLADVEVLPAPLALKSEKPKGTAGDLPWWTQATAPTKRVDALRQSDDGPKLKRPEDDLFVFRESKNTAWTAFRPARRVRLRNGRPNPKQAEPSLFAIEQIVEETYFLAELHGSVEDMKTLAAQLAPVLEGRRWLRIGRAGAPVEVVDLDWCNPAPPTPVQDKALLILTSDLLVRDELLRWRTALDGTALAHVLGVEVTMRNELQDSVMIHGFNGTARLWRMPAAAIRRGSVFEISGPGLATLAARAAKDEWLGERTHEGFGRFRIDSVTALPGVTGATPSPTAPHASDAHPEESIAAETKKWFDAHEALAEPASASERKPSLSQWMDLVGELEAENPSALTSRLNPTTAGAKSWTHKDAKAILDQLSRLQAPERKRYARYFVRWLRAAMHKKPKEA